MPCKTDDMKTLREKMESMDAVRNRMNGKKNLGELLVDGESMTNGDKDLLVNALVSDSRRVTPGCAFFAMPGMRTDGASYIRDAIDRGAHAIVTEKDSTDIPASVAKVKVSDARKTMASWARRYHGNPDAALNLVGVTGTNGKTTVTTLTRHLLEEPGKPVGLIGTVCYHLGDREVPSFRTTPESADLYPLLKSMLVAGCSEAVMEVSSHGIHQQRVSGLQLEVAAFLNLSRDHLDYHDGMEEYYREKRKIFNGENGSMPKIAVINGDCPYGLRLAESLPPQVRVLKFGLGPDNEFKARNLAVHDQGTEFLLESPCGSHMVTSPMLGRYNVMNLLASLAILHALGRNVADSIRKVGSFEGVDGRMEKIERGQGFKVVVDYAHTPDALRNALGMLRECTDGNLHVVFGCGGDRDKGKRLEMTRVACAGADRIWATADNPRTESLNEIFKDMRKGISAGSDISFVEDRRRAISLALDEAKSGDCVLIAGKGHEEFQEVQYTAIPFDDRQVAKELLKAKAMA